MSSDNRITDDELACFLPVLQRIADDPAIIQEEERIKALIAKIHRTGKKGERRAHQQERQRQDRAVRRLTAMAQRDLQQKPLATVSDVPDQDRTDPLGIVHRSLRCYRCKQFFTSVHFFYHLLCPECAALCYEKRQQRTDLSNRTALITGGRLKIGYQMALRMLRDGARVVLTTRFPADASRRFAKEEDADEWLDRLVIHGLDLRHLPSVEAFLQHLNSTEPYLDILVNHAAQTVKRPLEFYAHLLSAEMAAQPPDQPPVLLEARKEYPSHTPLLLTGRAGIEGDNFPEGERDAYGQQVDKRKINSWSLSLKDVSALEMLEVQLVNAIAPFMLCSQLKPLLMRSPHSRRFIVNVSAVEGQFDHTSRTARHPHTNMAKAALNMLTRTSAADYARDSIYMNSVDTGWVSNENPHERRVRQQENNGFHPPLDVLDGMARLYDPIVRGLQEADEPLYGLYLKDFASCPW